MGSNFTLVVLLLSLAFVSTIQVKAAEYPFSKTADHMQSEGYSTYKDSSVGEIQAIERGSGEGINPEQVSRTMGMYRDINTSKITTAAIVQPTINSVTYAPNPVPRYGKIELTIDLTASYTNPFDPDDIDLWAVFSSPSSEDWNVKGFWDGTHWKIRFAANEIGLWQFTVFVDDQAGHTNSEVNSFNVTRSSNQGWLRVSQTDPHFFAHDDGSTFYGIGQCRAWGLDEVPNLLSDMQSHGMNTLMYWMPSWDNMLTTLATGYDQYDMEHAGNIDSFVEDAEDHNIYLMLTIWNHDELRGAGHPWGRPYFDEQNPYRDISTATGFMSDAASWSYQQKLYRYIIARWGYSTAIGWWHTVCEIDGTTNSYNNDAATDPWHNKINSYFKNNDPFQHPTSASKAGDLWWPNGYALMDVPQIHSYAEKDDAIAVADKLAYWTRRMQRTYNKPNVIGEFGTSSEELQPRHLHNGIWASFSSGAAVSALDWNDGGSWGDFSPEMYDHSSYLANFASEFNFDQLGLMTTTVSIDSEFKAWGMNGADAGYLWVQDTSPGEINYGTSITISGLTEGEWELQWYNTWTGTYYEGADSQQTSGESIFTFIPDFKDDIACRLRLKKYYNLKVAVEPDRGGQTKPAVGIHNYSEGSVIDIFAMPNVGYKFDRWSGDCTSSGLCQVTIDGDMSATAHFIEKEASDSDKYQIYLMMIVKPSEHGVWEQ